MDIILLTTIVLIGIALAFDFTNGFHDAANSVSTIIGTGTLKPRTAILLAAFFNFIGLFVFQLHVAATIGKGMVTPSVVDFAVIGGALAGAIAWNMITWWYGLPSSSSHALIGGVVGAAIMKGGLSVVLLSGLSKIALFIIISPMIGFILAALISFALQYLLPKVKDNAKAYRIGQILSSSLYSIGHGTNDAQKTAGVIFLILISGGYMQAADGIPYWVAMVSFLVIALGTLAGGWRIINTLAYKITDLKPRGGFSAEFGGSIMLFTSSSLGIPVSTTHIITGAIVGVGSIEKNAKINWSIVKTILICWCLTIPSAGAMGALFYLALRYLGLDSVGK
ncbi:MAG: inorganic phosphate transporter [Hydrotalea sp.]|nr:inorganic phosphate transporter [Hydrotalea sp.]